jgi:hypothetical protein
MRWADLGPTPGRQRRAAINSSSDEGVFTDQNGSFMPGGSGKPAVTPDIFS